MIQEQKLSFQCPACRSTLNVPAHMAGVVGPCPHCRNEITAPNPQYQQPAQLAVRQAPPVGNQLQAETVPQIPGGRQVETATEAPPLPAFPSPAPITPQPLPVEPRLLQEEEDNDLNLGQALATPVEAVPPIVPQGVEADAFQQLLQAQANAPQQQPAFPFPVHSQAVPAQPIAPPVAAPIQPAEQQIPVAPPLAEPFPQPEAQQVPAPVAAPLPVQEPIQQATPVQAPVAPEANIFAGAQPQQQAPAPVQPVQQQIPQQQQFPPQQQSQEVPVQQQPVQPQAQAPAPLPEAPSLPPQAAPPASAEPFAPSLIPTAAPTAAHVQQQPSRSSASRSKKKEKKERKLSSPSSSGGLIKKLLMLILLAGCAFGAVKFWPQIREKASGIFGESNRPPAGPSLPSTEPVESKKAPTDLPLGPQNTGKTPAKPTKPENAQPKKTRIDQPGPSLFPDSSDTSVNPPRPDEDEPEVKKAVPANLDAVENDPDQPSIEDIDAAKDVLMKFMEAKSVDDRLPLVQSPAKVERQMRDYYNRHPYPMAPESVEFKLANKLEDSESRFFVFEVTTTQQKLAFPVAIEETDAGLKVDWRSFVEFHDNMLGRFMNVYQAQPERFRVMMERAHYFKDDVPDKGSKLCLRIKSPIPGFEGYAFVSKDTVIGRELDRKFEWDILYLPILELQWHKTDDGQKYVRVLNVVQDNWRASE